MGDLTISLLREKFIIGDWSSKPLKAFSNRIVLDLERPDGEIAERFIIRTKTMASCAMLTSEILKSYQALGPLIARKADFSNMWQSTALSDYEREYNKNLWAAVYHDGAPVFEYGQRNTFLDIIEACDNKNKGAYENAIPFVEENMAKAGKSAKIEYEANIGLMVNAHEETARCGLMFRYKGKNRTVQILVDRYEDSVEHLDQPQILKCCASIIEGTHLAYQIGQRTKELKESKRTDAKKQIQNRKGKEHLERLYPNMNLLESACEVTYRPDRPNFLKIIGEAMGD